MRRVVATGFAATEVPYLRFCDWYYDAYLDSAFDAFALSSLYVDASLTPAARADVLSDPVPSLRYALIRASRRALEFKAL